MHHFHRDISETYMYTAMKYMKIHCLSETKIHQVATWYFSHSKSLRVSALLLNSPRTVFHFCVRKRRCTRRKQQRGPLMFLAVRPRQKKTILHCESAVLRDSIIVTRNRRTRSGNGHLSRRGHALSRATAYEKASRRNNWWPRVRARARAQW